MVNWRTYKITNRTTNSGYIAFELDGYVTFESGETRKRIDCKNTYPWNSVYQGDYLEINLDETRRWGPGHDFDSTSEVRKGSMSIVPTGSNSQSLIGGRSYLNVGRVRQGIDEVNRGRNFYSREAEHHDESGDYYEYVEYTKDHAHYERERKY